MIRVCDTDHSGVIEFNEFILMMHENDKISEEDVRSGFRIFDKDGDGNITPSELKYVMTHFQNNFSFCIIYTYHSLIRGVLSYTKLPSRS